MNEYVEKLLSIISNISIDDIKKYLDGILHLYDEGRTKTSMPELLGMVEQSEQKLLDKQNSVAP